MTEHIFFPGEIIYNKGELQPSVYFIQKGSAEVVLNKKSKS